MRTIGFIGVGELALYTIKGLRRGGYSGPVLLSPRNAQKSAWLASHLACEVRVDNQSVVANSDLVVIATRPDTCLDTLAQLDFRTGQVLLSVVAGVTIASLRSALSQPIDIVRAMPVSCAEVAASPTLVYPQHDFVETLFNHCGQSIVLQQEESFDQGSILACVYTWYFALFEELIQATQGPNLPADTAASLVMGMARGAAEMALAENSPTPGEVAQHIATEGTFSKLGLDLLEQKAAFTPWREACALLAERMARG